MKIVIAPDSFKESMSAKEAALAMERGILKVVPEADIIKMPMADGGEGTVQAIKSAIGGSLKNHMVTGALGNQINANYLVTADQTAVIEIAAVCGLGIIPESDRDPMCATTYGIGELILHALDEGVRHFIIGLGGSATNDGGIGMAQALGVQITDTNGRAVAPGASGTMEVGHISIAGLDPRLKDCAFDIASDVTNPLTGPKGATYVYGPQKGVAATMAAQLDVAMIQYAAILKEAIGKDVASVPGAGAAGGLGAACLAFLDAEVKPGIERIMMLTGLEEHIMEADVVFTGEGKIDGQTDFGKTPAGIAKLAQKYAVPVIVIAGANEVTSNAIYKAGVTAIFSIADRPMSLEYAMKHGESLVEKLTENVVRMLHYGHEDKPSK